MIRRLAPLFWPLAALWLWALANPVAGQSLLFRGAADSVSTTASADSALAAAHALLEEFERRESFSYEADLVLTRGDSIVLVGNAVVKHKGAVLEAGRMVLRRDQERIEASGLLDSSGTLTQAPVLKRQDETLKGEHIRYDMTSGTGTIAEGRIAYKKGYYAGDQIRALSAKEFHVHHGTYTTCDLDRPHFDFFSPRIKVLAGDMAIARPVYLRVAEKRLFWIPFFVFSLRENRQSGILTPSFGRRPVSFGSVQQEWEIRNLGYYIAPNDYWDLTLAADLRQRSGWLGRTRLNYAQRYHWKGSVETQFENRQAGQSTQLEWRTNVNHSQEFGRDASLRASGAFQSNKTFNRDNSDDLEDRLNRTLRSNLTYSKRWRAAGRSLSVNASKTENLDTGTFTRVLPDVNFRTTRKALFPGPANAPSSSRNAEAWYRRLFYDTSARLRDTQRGTTRDTTQVTSLDLNLRLSSQLKPVPWLNLTPSLTSAWRDADLRRDARGARGVRTDRLSAGTSLSQTLYGLFHPQWGPLTALRHVFKPSIGLNYQATRADTGGFLGVGGRSSAFKQTRRLDLRLDNTLWAKWQQGEDERKLRLAQLNFSSGYDFEDKDRPLEDLVTRLTVGGSNRFDSRLTLTSEFYDAADRLQARPRLRQLEVNTSLRFSGGRTRSDSTAADDGAAPNESRYGAGPGFGGSPGGLSGSSYGYQSGLRQDIRRDLGGWSFRLGHYYSRRRAAGNTTRRSWLQTGLGLGLAGRWHINYSLNYNLQAPGKALFAQDRVTSELLSVQRRFHDWNATFNFEPSRFHQNRAFYFRAQFNDIPQIKFERGDSRL